MIRVLRIIEYTYETPEQMEADVSRWQVGANGSKSLTWGKIKSATMPLEVVNKP